jgi:ATP-binding cassette, subfamily B, bacterial PglK
MSEGLVGSAPSSGSQATPRREVGASLHFVDLLFAVHRRLSPRRRKQLMLTLVLMLLGAVAELLTIGAVLPFLILMAEPQRLSEVPAAAALLDGLAGILETSVVLAAAIFLVSTAVVAAVVRLLLAWFSQRFVYGLGHDLGVDIYSTMLRQPYSFHAERNTSEVIAGVEKVQSVIRGLLMPVMQGVTASFIALCIVGILFAIDPTAALAASISMGAVYVAVSLLARRVLRRNSLIMSRVHGQRVRQIQEGLGGIRDIIIDQSQALFESSFRSLDRTFRNAQATTEFLAATPRFIVEAAGIALITCLAFYLGKQEAGLAASIPTLGALALGAQRLLPLLQLVYLGWSQLNANRHVLGDVLGFLDVPIAEEAGSTSDTADSEPFRGTVEFENVGFRYARGPQVLVGIDLSIARGARMGIIGATGSGKSTLVDLLMGLLNPTEGQILVDGQRLDAASRRHWQSQLAHVPQAIYLSDASVAANIAFGQADEDIDMARVRAAARQAAMDEFVSALPDGYATPVGERGIRLSGGQRQRIGIARALYKKAGVLIFDEATSALDDATEAAIVDTIFALQGDLTVIMIAHRLTTLARCDAIVRLGNGRVLEMGPYSAVVAKPERYISGSGKNPRPGASRKGRRGPS